MINLAVASLPGAPVNENDRRVAARRPTCPRPRAGRGRARTATSPPLPYRCLFPHSPLPEPQIDASIVFSKPAKNAALIAVSLLYPAGRHLRTWAYCRTPYSATNDKICSPWRFPFIQVSADFVPEGSLRLLRRGACLHPRLVERGMLHARRRRRSSCRRHGAFHPCLE